ncbi:MAG: transglycosylase domain-containing protein [Mediterraneibacter gnavus]
MHRYRAKEDYTTLDQLPKDYIDAVLAVEDKRFYRHPGIDPHCDMQGIVQRYPVQDHM